APIRKSSSGCFPTTATGAVGNSCRVALTGGPSSVGRDEGHLASPPHSIPLRALVCSLLGTHGTTCRANTKRRAKMPAAKKSRTTEKDAITLLTDDHKQVRALLGELDETTEKAGDKREKLLATIEQELTIHTRIEEEIFYPAFRDAARKKDDGKLYFEALEEHHVVDMVLPEIKGTRVESEQFAAKAKVLKDLVEHHAEEEETEMFPRARKLMTRDELLRLGAEMAQLKASMARGLVSRLAGLVGA